VTLGLRTRIGARPHKVMVHNPGTLQPDGDGGYVNVPSVSPLPWWVSITSAQASDLQNAEAGTVLATKVHIVRGQYRGDITTKSQLAFTDLDGKTRTFDIDGIDNTEQRNFELVLSCTELESPPAPPPAPPNVLDDFNRADESPLSKGGQWQKPGQFDLPLQLVGNMAGFPSIGQGGSFWMTPVAGDFEISATISVLPDTGNNSQFGLALLPDATNRGYMACVMVNNVPPQVLLDQPSGARPSAVIPGVVAEGDAVALSRIGQTYTIKLRLDGVWNPLLVVDDPSMAGPLYPGLWIQNYVASALTRLDDFTLVTQ